MKCPTCGKSVKQQQAVCPNCGALVTGLAPTKKSDVPKLDLEEIRRTIGRRAEPAAPPAEPLAVPSGAPMVEEVEEEFGPEEQEPTSAPPETPRPAPPGWTRWISPIFFLLVFFVMQFWLRDSREPPGLRTQPILRQAVLCESVSGGRPINPKTAFSLRQDRQVAFFGRWEGDPEGHSFVLRVYAPVGTRRTEPILRVRPGPGRRDFTTEAAISLEPSLPAGQWRVDLLVDLERVERLRFELRE